MSSFAHKVQEPRFCDSHLTIAQIKQNMFDYQSLYIQKRELYTRASEVVHETGWYMELGDLKKGSSIGQIFGAEF